MGFADATLNCFKFFFQIINILAAKNNFCKNTQKPVLKIRCGTFKKYLQL